MSGPSVNDLARTALVRERQSALQQIEALAMHFDDFAASAREAATDDEHDPEGHTIAFERQQVAALLESARARLVELDRAIGRVDSGTFGSCEACGESIPSERLSARPAARTCVSCAAKNRRFRTL